MLNSWALVIGLVGLVAALLISVARSKKAQDRRAQAELGRGAGIIDRLAARVQSARLRPIAGHGDGLGIKAQDDGVHPGRADTDHVIFHGCFLAACIK